MTVPPQGGTASAAGPVAGVDGCPAGWVAVTLDAGAPHLAVHADFAAILAAEGGVIAVDMPIGLPDRVGLGGRGPERLVRPLLGERQSSVFSVPSRAAVWAVDDLDAPDAYRTICDVAFATSEPPRKISRQCFHILPKIREIDRLMTPALSGRVFEVHPEVAFWRLNGGSAMRLPKKVKNRAAEPGLAERIDLLVRHGYPRAFLEQALPRGVGRDDLIDAAVNALIAVRIAAGEARPFPDPPERDGRGLTVAIWA
ncbi:hypothetical protein ABB55_17150 [Prosthecomicrobium hirschii]|uniref:NUDIX hydrolase n=1 Tax=Prosthecodimorpha hirschii TaxID=665126 RepID=A0A0P6VM55_9HYPH|nr:DUF429 domain-containing protein [Prosthecomicrobium hirschii]KPL53726.1 hypothetical protein ABB55_17150 [Prosthecomicrobium hirschii]